MVSTFREPVDIEPGRIAPLARLPVFLALHGKRAIVAGGTSAAAWKAELLLAAGANVDVYSNDPSEEMIALAGRSLCGRLAIHRRSWTAGNLEGAAVAIGSCEQDCEAQRFADAARAAGVPVNVIDKPRFCDFSFGSIVNRSPLVIGISTDGAAPIFAQAIRARIEALLPPSFARWAAAAARWRPAVMRSGLPFASRRKLWRLFTAHAVSHPDREPSDGDLERFLTEARALGAGVEAGSVTLVGAGPGDPDLLTLRALRALQSADIVLFDDQVSNAILDFARREARRMLVGKTGHGPSCRQDDINTLMVNLAKAGKHVVRLKGGDPMIFGRAGEEIAACRAAGIAVEVIPGITAAQGAAAQLALPLTHRGEARRVQYITGYSKDGALPPDIDWRSLADPATTTAIYMPTRTLAAMVDKALENGLDPDTPAVVVAAATRPEQTVIAARIADLPCRLSEEAPHGPILVMMGRLMAAQIRNNRVGAMTSACDRESTPLRSRAKFVWC
jgi:uroporphyrin-III C-methyltransferase/precorrin-2 dehydrogenase/sirohydrochlorin ferrochelatase